MRIVVGDNAAYETESLQARKLAVEVTDEAGTPVSGVAVTFRLPEEGATGLFPDGNRSAVVYTTEQGQAAAPGIRWGGSAGTVSIRITAVKGAAHAGILAQQQLITRGAARAAAPVAVAAAPTSATVPVAAAAHATITASPTPVPPAVAASTEPATAAKAAIPQPPAKAPVSSQVTILTQPEKARPDPIARASITPIPTAAEAKAKEPPAVTISGAPPGHGSSGKTKWVLLGLAAAGAAAGVAFAMGGSKSSSSATPPPAGTTIGAPSISIGHP
ncbi:MAG: hypothetical protein WBW33_34895 [Bryobacteraceae bacterium]